MQTSISPVGLAVKRLISISFRWKMEGSAAAEKNVCKASSSCEWPLHSHPCEVATGKEDCMLVYSQFTRPIVYRETAHGRRVLRCW